MCEDDATRDHVGDHLWGHLGDNPPDQTLPLPAESAAFQAREQLGSACLRPAAPRTPPAAPVVLEISVSEAAISGVAGHWRHVSPEAHHQILCFVVEFGFPSPGHPGQELPPPRPGHPPKWHMGLVTEQVVLGESLSARSGLAPGEVAAGGVTALCGSPRGAGTSPPTMARGELGCWCADPPVPCSQGLGAPQVPHGHCLRLSAPRAPSPKPCPPGAPSPNCRGSSQPICFLQSHLESHQQQRPSACPRLSWRLLSLHAVDLDMTSLNYY